MFTLLLLISLTLPALSQTTGNCTATIGGVQEQNGPFITCDCTIKVSTNCACIINVPCDEQ